VIADSNNIDVIDTIIAGGLLMVGTIVAAWLQNRKTRRLNTEEHDRGAAERAEAHSATLLAIGLVHDDVKDLKQDLKDHIADEHAHSTGV